MVASKIDFVIPSCYGLEKTSYSYCKVISIFIIIGLVDTADLCRFACNCIEIWACSCFDVVEFTKEAMPVIQS